MPRKPKNVAQEATATDPYEGLSDDNHNEFLADLLKDAEALATERADVLARQGKNREAVRLVAGTGHLSEKQEKAVSIFYPVRVQKDDATTATTPPADTPADTPAAA